uniref:tyrosine-type recombinase/integrase n=1 Tax=Eubacterium cellulosolvens TaxID=29322 RepID=UPI002418288E|nr:site-specific integrase [[Eubacterium] cellulosolvens]
MAEEWLIAIQKVLKHSTYVRYQSIYRRRIQPVIGDCLPTEISQIMVKMCLGLGGNAGSRPSASYVNTTLNIMRQILLYADPAIHTDELMHGIIKPRTVQKTIEVFSSEEQRRLLNVLEQHPDSYKTGILICLMTGCRLGEICALKNADISMENETIHIHSTVQRIQRPVDFVDDQTAKKASKTVLLVTSPKSQKSDRIIPLPDYLHSFLRKYPLKGEFAVNNTKLMEPRTYENKFTTYQKMAQITPKNFHTLRHTFATNCVAGGMDPKVLSELLGHSSVTITLNRYVHPTDEMKKKQLNDVYKNITGVLR